MISLKVSNPNKMIFDDKVSSVVLKTVEGEIEILPKHIPLISVFKDGYVKLNDEKVEIKSGSLIVKDDIVTILINH